MALRLEGSMTALVTPFRDAKLDEAAFTRHVEWQIAEGTSALVPAGTTGESATLTREEQLEVIRLCVKTAKGRVPTIAGTGKNDTAGTIELSRAAKEIGADAALVVTPYYNKPTQEGLYRHYRAIADAVDLPIVLYNVPGRTGVNMLPETVARCAEHPRIVATKEASGDLVQAAEIVRLCGSRLALISGEDALTFPLIALGAVGFFCVSSIVVPGVASSEARAAGAADYAAARAHHGRLLPLMRALFLESNPIPVKAALARIGRIEPEVRLPLAPLSSAPLAKLESAMKELGLVS